MPKLKRESTKKGIISDAKEGGYAVKLQGPYGPIEDPETRQYILDDEKTFSKYLGNIGKMSEEIQTEVIWGRTDIEGKMICEKYKVKIEVIELKEEPVDNRHIIISEQGEGNNVVRIVNYKYHFVPLLSSLENDIEENVKVSKEEVYGIEDRKSPFLIKDIRHRSQIILSNEPQPGSSYKQLDQHESQSSKNIGVKRPREKSDERDAPPEKRVFSQVNLQQPVAHQQPSPVLLDQSSNIELFEATPGIQHGRKRKAEGNEGQVVPVKRPTNANQRNQQPNPDRSTQGGGEGVRSSLHGVIYQLKLSMLFLQTALDKDYKFELYSEKKDAEKFDDVVFKYSKG